MEGPLVATQGHWAMLASGVPNNLKNSFIICCMTPCIFVGSTYIQPSSSVVLVHRHP